MKAREKKKKKKICVYYGEHTEAERDTHKTAAPGDAQRLSRKQYEGEQAKLEHADAAHRLQHRDLQRHPVKEQRHYSRNHGESNGHNSYPAEGDKSKAPQAGERVECITEDLLRGEKGEPAGAAVGHPEECAIHRRLAAD